MSYALSRIYTNSPFAISDSHVELHASGSARRQRYNNTNERFFSELAGHISTANDDELSDLIAKLLHCPTEPPRDPYY